MTIPLYTTDEPPVDGQTVVAGWLEWGQSSDLSRALHILAGNAINKGAHAVVGVRLMEERPTSGFEAHRYTAYGTAVRFG